MHHIISSAFRSSLSSHSRRAISTAVAPVPNVIVNAFPINAQSTLIRALGPTQYHHYLALLSDRSPFGEGDKRFLRLRLEKFVEQFRNASNFKNRRREIRILRQLVEKMFQDATKPKNVPAVSHVLDSVFQRGSFESPQLSRTKSKQEDAIHGWKREEWGVDKLQSEVKSQSSQSSGTKPPLPSYSRRVEGFIHPLNIPVLEDVTPKSEHKPVAKLSHNLDRVLFNPGVHWLKDPRTGVYNFSSWLENVPSVENFAFDRVSGFITSSRDEDLRTLTKEEDRLFGGSTSSLSGMLSHIYFLISGGMPVNISSLSRDFEGEPTNFTPGQRMPVSVLLKYKDGTYSIDSFSEDDDPEKNILSWMGILLEKFFTTSPEKFKLLLRDSPNPADLMDTRREAYRYCKSSKMMMRAQLDCRDPRLPGTGVFDLKTRAVMPVRLDYLNYKEYAGYTIQTLNGRSESFEKEYYDLIRSAFLKYTFQARIGNMDGVLVAHHNASRIFGFQYIPLTDMESCLYGGSNRGQHVFEKCVLLLEEVLMEAIACFPKQSVRCLVETLENTDMMRFWIEPEDHGVNEEGLRPIAQLDIQVYNVLERRYVNGKEAIAGIGEKMPWMLHWKISRSTKSEEFKRMKKREAEERMMRAFNLPSGVDIDQMESIWNQIDYSGKRLNEEHPSSFVSSRFRPASQHIEKLRKLSREGMDRSKARVDDQTDVVEQNISEFTPRPQVHSQKLLSAMDLVCNKVGGLTHSEPGSFSPTSTLTSDVAAQDFSTLPESPEAEALPEANPLEGWNQPSLEMTGLEWNTFISSTDTTNPESPLTDSTLQVNDVQDGGFSSDGVQAPPETDLLEEDTNPSSNTTIIEREEMTLPSSIEVTDSESLPTDPALEVDGVQNPKPSSDDVQVPPMVDLLEDADQSSNTTIIERDENTLPSSIEVANSESSPVDPALEVDGIQRPDPLSDGVEALLDADIPEATDQSSNPALIEFEEKPFPPQSKERI